MADLDSILSGNSEAAPETEQVIEEQVTESQEATEQEDEQQGQKMVPHEALHAEKQKVKRYTEQVADFQRQLSETNAAWERRMADLVEAVKPKQEPQAPPDWFENPDAALNSRLGTQIQPINGKLANLETQLIRLSAMQAYGAEKVTAFEAYVADAMSRGDPEMAALGAQMRASSDPMKTGLDWFEKRTFDPNAERERIKAELLAELQGQQEQQAQQRPAPVLPSNLAGARNVGTRNGPAWAGPTPLTDIFTR